MEINFFRVEPIKHNSLIRNMIEYGSLTQSRDDYLALTQRHRSLYNRKKMHLNSPIKSSLTKSDFALTGI